MVKNKKNMKLFEYAIFLFFLPQFVLLSCNTHAPYRTRAGGDWPGKCSTEACSTTRQNNTLTGKLVIGGDAFKIEPKWDKEEIMRQVNEARLALSKLDKPFTCIEHDIDDKYYIYGPSKYYPDSLDRQIAHHADKGFKDKPSISRDLCIVGLSRKKYYFYPRGNRLPLRCPADNTAYYVAQGEVCYSTDRKMGTNNVQDCVALIIQDKNTGSTALAHVSTATLNLVDEILAYMPKGPKDVILVGGQHKSGEYNLNTILKELLQYDDTIHIVQAYCGNTGSLLFDDPDTRALVATSFYHINTNFGNVIVDPKGLKVTTDYPSREIPSDCKVQYSHYDLDKYKDTCTSQGEII